MRFSCRENPIPGVSKMLTMVCVSGASLLPFSIIVLEIVPANDMQHNEHREPCAPSEGFARLRVDSGAKTGTKINIFIVPGTTLVQKK
eukprot:5942997-Amphidinium_carterae.1